MLERERVLFPKGKGEEKRTLKMKEREGELPLSTSRKNAFLVSSA